MTAPPEAATTPTATPVPTPSGISVEILTAPDTAVAGKSFVVTWSVNSQVQKNIAHTAVHYGSEPKAEPLTLASYPSLTTPLGGTIPANFNTSLVINTTGVTYFRAHAIVDGSHYWSPEKMITISAPQNVTAATTPTPTPTATPTTGYGY